VPNDVPIICRRQLADEPDGLPGRFPIRPEYLIVAFIVQRRQSGAPGIGGAGVDPACSDCQLRDNEVPARFNGQKVDAYHPIASSFRVK
jgi:hypothetical protein